MNMQKTFMQYYDKQKILTIRYWNCNCTKCSSLLYLSKRDFWRPRRLASGQTTPGKKFADKINESTLVDTEEIKAYIQLVQEATIEELSHYDVIFCTTAMATNVKLVTGAKDRIFQVIIDGICKRHLCNITINTNYLPFDIGIVIVRNVRHRYISQRGISGDQDVLPLDKQLSVAAAYGHQST
jgi:hypothetical protein